MSDFSESVETLRALGHDVCIERGAVRLNGAAVSMRTTKRVGKTLQLLAFRRKSEHTPDSRSREAERDEGAG